MSVAMPLGIHRFDQLRQPPGTRFYVDKTPLLHALMEVGHFFFLARPPRFGKSLLLDTLACLFEGRKALFKGLQIAEYWQWNTYPVLRLDLSGSDLTHEADLSRLLYRQLDMTAARWKLSLPESVSPADRLDNLLDQLVRQTGLPVVILIDALDGPLLAHLDHPQQLTPLRLSLRRFLSVLQHHTENIHLLFMTGTLRWSIPSLFGPLTDLIDISLDPHFDTLCGFTPEELAHHPALTLSARQLEELTRWYGGYRFPETQVLNPFDVLHFLHHDGQPDAYWWEYAQPDRWLTPVRDNPADLPVMLAGEVSRNRLDLFDETLNDPMLRLWHGGLLSIHASRFHRNHQLYQMTLPNLEVQTGLGDYMLDQVFHVNGRKETGLDILYHQLQTHQLHALEHQLWIQLAQLSDQNTSARMLLTFLFSLLAACGLPLQFLQAPEQDTFQIRLEAEQYRYRLFCSTRHSAESGLRQLADLPLPDTSLPVTDIALHLDADMGNIDQMRWHVFDTRQNN